MGSHLSHANAFEKELILYCSVWNNAWRMKFLDQSVSCFIVLIDNVMLNGVISGLYIMEKHHHFNVHIDI